MSGSSVHTYSCTVIGKERFGYRKYGNESVRVCPDSSTVKGHSQITGEYGMDEINKINETDLQRLVM